MTDDEFDVHLARLLDEHPLPDEGFTRAFESRLASHRRRRRAALAGASGLAAGVSAAGLWLSGAPLLAPFTVNGGEWVAALLLAGACGGIWIVTTTPAIPRLTSWPPETSAD